MDGHGQRGEGDVDIRPDHGRAPSASPRRRHLTPAEVADALDLLARAVAGDLSGEERTVAGECLRGIRGLLHDVRSGPDDVLIGRQASLIKPSVTLMKLQCLQPRSEGGVSALDGMLTWIEAQAGTRGRRSRDFTLVTNDGHWAKVLEHQPPLVYNR